MLHHFLVDKILDLLEICFFSPVYIVLRITDSLELLILDTAAVIENFHLERFIEDIALVAHLLHLVPVLHARIGVFPTSRALQLIPINIIDFFIVFRSELIETLTDFNLFTPEAFDVLVQED